MTYEAVQCRLVNRVGTANYYGAFWGDPDSCGGNTIHSQRVEGGDGKINYDWTPTACDTCGAVYAGERIRRHAGFNYIYDTADGKTHPGDMYWNEDYEGECFHWDNCEGRHLYVILPNGHAWDIDGRARNCGSREDRLHRCWVRQGDPPNVSVTKDGHTCQAGAGSIASGDYHGFLQGGWLTRG